MSCGVNTKHTFLYPSLPLTEADIETLSSKDYPFTVNFGPGGAPPTLSNWTIYDTENHTILYNGANYQLISTQICTPTHTNMVGSKTTYGYDIVMTFVNWYQSVKIVLIIVPIMEGAYTNKNGAYLKQFTHESSPEPLNTLFTDSSGSFGYPLCISLHTPNSSSIIPINTDIYYFRTGAVLNSKDYNTLFGNAQIPAFQFLPGGWRGSWQTALYDLSGNPTYSAEGALSKSPMPVNELKSWVKYHTLSPPTSGSNKCPYIPVSQYKCYPFDQLQNLTTDADGTPVVSPLPLQQAIQTQNKTGGYSMNLSCDTIHLFIWPLIGFIVLIILLAIVLFAISYFSKPPPLKEIPVEAGGPPVAAGTTGTTGTAPPPAAAPK
jgi:uncharacterized membrane protein